MRVRMVRGKSPSRSQPQYPPYWAEMLAQGNWQDAIVPNIIASFCRPLSVCQQRKPVLIATRNGPKFLPAEISKKYPGASYDLADAKVAFSAAVRNTERTTTEGRYSRSVISKMSTLMYAGPASCPRPARAGSILRAAATSASVSHHSCTGHQTVRLARSEKSGIWHSIFRSTARSNAPGTNRPEK